MRGPPSVAGRDRVKGQGNAALGKGSSRTVRSKLERGYRDKSPPVERRKARLPRKGGRGAFAKGAPVVTCAVSALRLPQGGMKDPGQGPEKPTGKSGDPRNSSRGAEEACLQGCLKIESAMSATLAPPGHSGARRQAR